MSALRRLLGRGRPRRPGSDTTSTTSDVGRAGAPAPLEAAEDDAHARLVEAREALAAGACGRAVTILAPLVVDHPDLAVAHRELANAAHELAVWGGSFEPDPDGGAPRFVTRHALAGEVSDDWIREVLTEPVAAGRAAIERAVELVPTTVAWLAPLAELREAAGDLDGAIDAWERAVAASETADSAWVVRSRHRWQFQLERAHARAGGVRVDDPLFDARIDPLTADHEPDRDVAGACWPRFTHQGLQVGVRVADPDVATVELMVDGTVLREANVGHGDGARPAELILRRPVLDVAPADAVVEIRTGDGRPLWIGGRAEQARLVLPTASARLPALLAEGRRVDKKGGLTPTAEEVDDRQATTLELYRRVADLLERDHGRSLVLLYGSLLGAHRDGRLIPGDDDLDCGYVATAGDPEGVKAEACELIEALVRAGFTVSFNRRGRLFRVHDDALRDPSLHLDVHPIWFEGDHLYVHNHHRFVAGVDDLLPAAPYQLAGGKILVPHRPEQLLERFYGPGWRVPDPGYVDDATGTDPEVMAHLGRALLTPAEHRQLAATIEASRDAHPGQGRLVSIAAQPLYPLADVIE